MGTLEVLDQIRELLRQKGRMTYGILKRQFALDDEALEDLKDELIEAERVAADENGKVLVWTGGETSEEIPTQTIVAPVVQPPSPAPSVQPERETPAGERRQLTVMFCDLVGSTALSEQLDPEELQTIVRTYQEVSAQVIERYAGYIAQYLGDGLLVYFGYPAAHEDDAARAIRAGLEIITALDQARSQFPQPVQVRIGIHTGPVVIGQMGAGERYEQLALGETPNIAARVQGKAEPDEVLMSTATQRLVAGLFKTQDRGSHDLKGISTPQLLYRVTAESQAQSRFEAAVRTGLTPLVGREDELAFLRQRWAQAQAGNGQAVLISGEPGIGKSRLMQELRERAASAGATHMTFQCSPYHHNSALYPIIEHLQRLLQFVPDDTPQTKLAKLQQTLGRYHFPQANTLALLATFLSLPHPEGVPDLTVSPQQQKELTQAAFVAWLIEETEQQAVYTSWEDLHWADPSTLEVLEILLTQVPTSRLLAVLTFRPEFVPPWGVRSYLSQLTLSRLGQTQVGTMVEQVTGGKTLPKEVLAQITAKTDGVPLFVEELTKMVVESNLVRAVNNHYKLSGPLAPLAIPSTLQDSLMARLDRLAPVKEVAQLGATIGREFSYELLQAISPLDAAVLQQALQQLLEAELVFQRGILPQARYVFKHALVRDTAYQSLLKSRRQQLHQQVAQVLEQQFAELVTSQPELLAHHYTEARLVEQALPYWQQAAQQAAQRFANTEAITHLTTGLELLQTLPDSPEHLQQELQFRLALGPPLMAVEGMGSAKLERSFGRTRELCRQLGDPPELFPILFGLAIYYQGQAEHQTAQALGEELLALAEQTHDSTLLVQAHSIQAACFLHLGRLVECRKHCERSLALYDPVAHRAHADLYGFDPGVFSGSMLASGLWLLGYPDQALQQANETLRLAQDRAHPLSLGLAFMCLGMIHHFSREATATLRHGESILAVAHEHDIRTIVGGGNLLAGWARASQGQDVEGVAQMQQGFQLHADKQAISQPYWKSLLIDTYRRTGQVTEGLTLVQEALSLVDQTEERFYEAELHRLQGELLLNDERRMMNDERRAREVEAETCFQRALDVARQQQAKSLELRAATSLARLWQRQAKTVEARDLLVPVYQWFTEGFDTADLKDAKALLDTLSKGM